MTPVEVLRKAKGLLEERGWCTGFLVNDKGQCCAEGAVVLAYGKYPEAEMVEGTAAYKDAYNFFVETEAGRLLALANGVSDVRKVWLWNDSARDAGEVLRGFDKAIAHAEALR